MGLLLKGLSTVGKAAWNVRPITGGIIGGAYGGLSTDEYSSNQVFRNTILGAAAGMGIGAATTKIGIGAMKGIGSGALSLGKRAVIAPTKAVSSHVRSGATLFDADLTMRESISYYGNRLAQGGIGKLGTKVGKAGASIGSFAMNHPYAATGVGLAGAGIAANVAGGMTSSSYTGENARGYSLQAGSSSPSRQALINSTHGLVQGMHGNRHGG
jgi:hypothetical protein